jgi:hypothetical protein
MLRTRCRSSLGASHGANRSEPSCAVKQCVGDGLSLDAESVVGTRRGIAVAKRRAVRSSRPRLRGLVAVLVGGRESVAEEVTVAASVHVVSRLRDADGDGVRAAASATPRRNARAALGVDDVFVVLRFATQLAGHVSSVSESWDMTLAARKPKWTLPRVQVCE